MYTSMYQRGGENERERERERRREIKRGGGASGMRKKLVKKPETGARKRKEREEVSEISGGHKHEEGG